MLLRFLLLATLTLTLSGCYSVWLPTTSNVATLPPKVKLFAQAKPLNVSLWSQLKLSAKARPLPSSVNVLPQVAKGSLCRTGMKQSPIDIRTSSFGTIENGGLMNIVEAYEPQSFSVSSRENTVVFSAIGNGQGYAFINDKPFKLKQFQYRLPAEHSIMGTHYPLAIQFIHESVAGEIAIISVMFNYGRKNLVLESLIASLPKDAVTEIELSQFDVGQLIPKENKGFMYSGSLTAPPCNEGVLWVIKSQPMIASQPQFQKLSRFYKHKNRPIQKRNERHVFYTE